MLICTTKATVFGECPCIFEYWRAMNAHNLSKVSLCTDKILIIMHIDNIGNNKYITYSISHNFFRVFILLSLSTTLAACSSSVKSQNFNYKRLLSYYV